MKRAFGLIGLLAAACCAFGAEKAERQSITWVAFNKADPGLKEIGRLGVRHSRDIPASKWSIGVETLDRDYADFNVFKRYIGELGAKHGRLFSGWAKTEKVKGQYQFAWLDPQVRELAAMGVKPWICLSYGNPIYGSDFNLGMSVKGVVRDPVAFAAWLKYCGEVVRRYRDVVNEWEIWNEPFGQGEDYSEMVLKTAEVIKGIQPEAVCMVTAVTRKDDELVLAKLKAAGKLDLIKYWIFHPYLPNPDSAKDGWWWGYSQVEAFQKELLTANPSYRVMQGEVGCPAQLEFGHALCDLPWTEYSQVKWDLRRMAGDAARDIPCNIFTMIDLQYTFMLQSFGMIRSNTLKQFVYRRPAFWGVQHMMTFFDSGVKPAGFASVESCLAVPAAELKSAAGRPVTVARFEKAGTPVLLAWYGDRVPGDAVAWDRVCLTVSGVTFKDPVWVEMVTGRVYEINKFDWESKAGDTRFSNFPMWDCPAMIAERAQVPLQKN